MRKWYSLDEAAAIRAAGCPTTLRGWEALAKREGWCENDKARWGWRCWEYHISLFPPIAQSLLIAREAEMEAEAKFSHLESLTDDERRKAEIRSKAVRAVDALMRAGHGKMASISRVAMDDPDLNHRTLRRWVDRVAGVPPSDYLVWLAPHKRGGSGPRHAECHPQAWAMLAREMSKPGKGGFAACLRRMRTVAERKGWAPIPSDAALRRRFRVEYPHAYRRQQKKGDR